MTADAAMVTSRISGGNAESAHSPWAGIFDRLQTATLGEFQVIRELGRGGMAAVFLAHDIHLDRKVAIKVMSPMLASDERMVERFRREAKTGAGLKHPNIGTVHRVLEGEGLYFFVMDFIRGRPLDAIIHRNGVLSVPVTRALLHQIGSGLAYAHRRKIYHRDVKPANVLVSAADGTAVVTDFGIAKVAESTTQTQTGAIVGTPSYMAPEQILGREITGAVDQYALGIMAYEMLTGAPPFVGTSFVVMHAHTEIQPRSLRESRPDCPVELDEAILRMLSKHPDQRWPSLPHALAAMGASMIGEDDPIREELIRLATPDEAESARFQTNTPLSPPPPGVTRGANVSMVAISPPPEIVEVGDSFRLTASPRDMRGNEVPNVPIEWASSNESVLAVKTDGTVIAVAAGTAEISAMAGRARGAVLLTVDPARVSNLQLSITPGVLMAGDRVQLAAHVMDKNQRQLGYAVRWGVADPNIARVSPEGVLEARAPGVVEVFAESNGVRSVTRIQIAPPAVASVQMLVDPQRPVVGDRIRVAATPMDAHGRPLRDRAVAWSLSDLSLVTIIGDGMYEATATGTLRVTAASEGKTGTIEIPIAPAPVAAVRVSPAPRNLVVGNVFKLTAAVVDAKEKVMPGRHVEWSSGDTHVASVTSDGTVTALAAGDVRIVASCEGKGGSAAVTIKPAPIAAVKITGMPQVVYVKMSFRLVATPTDARGVAVPKPVEWRSSNVSVLTVAQNGQVTALSVGHARITAVIDGVEGAVDLDVAEPAIPRVVVVPPPTPAPVDQPVVAPPTRQPTAEVGASAIFTPPSRMPREVDAPAAPHVPPSPPPTSPSAPAPSRGSRGRMMRGMAVGAVALAAIAILVAKQSGSDSPTPPTTVAATTPTDTTPVANPAAPVVSAPAPTTQAPIATVNPARPQTVASNPPVDPRKGTTKNQPPVATAPTPTTPAPVVQPDAFRIAVSPPGSIRVGDTPTLHATVERTSGTGPTPRTTWESNRTNVVRVDPSTGALTAVAEGQAVVTAIVGPSRVDVPVTVVAAPVAAPAPTNPPRANPQPETPARPAGPTAEELRTRAATTLRDAAGRLADAIKSKNAQGITQLLADGSNADSEDLVRQIRNLFGLTATIDQVGSPQITDRTATIEYKLKLHWTTTVGLERDRVLSMRAEAERSGDGWSVVRQRLLSGWR
jgi:eukaryotic-like serine/threonine-protein kinase